jgi:hypothetical protein
MEIAEQEISAGRVRYPESASQISSLFSYLCPPDGMRDFGNLVYRVYASEQIDRIGKQNIGMDIRRPTKTEILMALSRMSEKAPLTPDATKLYFDLFSVLFPDHAILKDIEPMHESYKGACNEIRDEIVKHLGMINRRHN